MEEELLKELEELKEWCQEWNCGEHYYDDENGIKQPDYLDMFISRELDRIISSHKKA
jgi:hypothetical protein